MAKELSQAERKWSSLELQYTQMNERGIIGSHEWIWFTYSYVSSIMVKEMNFKSKGVYRINVNKQDICIANINERNSKSKQYGTVMNTVDRQTRVRKDFQLGAKHLMGRGSFLSFFFFTTEAGENWIYMWKRMKSDIYLKKLHLKYKKFS